MNRLLHITMQHRALLKALHVAIILAVIIATLVAPSVVAAGPNAWGP
jgi:hypothetical protein